jgi:hypothetical protein
MTKFSEHRPNVQTWIERLREPGLLQAQGQLMAEEFADGPRSYCCLGVAEEVRGCTWRHRNGFDRDAGNYGPGVPFVPVHADDVAAEVEERNGANLHMSTARWLGVRERDPFVAVRPALISNWVDGTVQTLSMLNDNFKLSLRTIADVIQAQEPDWDGTYDRARADLPRIVEEYAREH